MNLARDGDSRSWEVLYRQTYPRVYRRLRFLLGDPNRAEEFTQDTYITAMVSIHSYEDGSFTGWLSTIALNLVRKHWRRERVQRRAHARLELVHDLAPSSASDPEAGLSARRNEMNLRRSVDTLPPKLREVFILRHMEGVSCAEVAELLGITETNVSVRAHRARAQVKASLARRGLIEDTEGFDG